MTSTGLKHIAQDLADAEGCTLGSTQQAVQLDAARKHIPYLPVAERPEARKMVKTAMRKLGYYA